MRKERFYGYIYDENGMHDVPELLNGKSDFRAFVEQHLDAPKLIVTDILDRRLFESRDGEVVFPRTEQDERLNTMLRCLIVEPHQPPREVVIENNLETMQRMVGGFVSFSHVDNTDALLVCNAAGRTLELEANRRVADNVISGTFLIVAKGEGALVSLSDEQVEQYKERFQSDEVFTQEESQNSQGFEFHLM